MIETNIRSFSKILLWLPLSMMFSILLLCLTSCKSPKKSDSTLINKVENTIQTDSSQSSIIEDDSKVYEIKSAYLKYTSSINLTKEIWFDDYGAKQCEESYMENNGVRSGTRSFILDGYKYDQVYGSGEITKMKYTAAPSTDYDKVSYETRKEYGIKKVGNETINGKYCIIVTVEKPVKSTIWLWKGIPMKSVNSMGNKELTLEVTKMDESPIDPSKFELPKGAKIIAL